MNSHTTTPNQRLTLISKNGGIHVGWAEVLKTNDELVFPEFLSAAGNWNTPSF